MILQLYHTWVEPEVYNEVTYAKCAEPYAWPLSRFIPRLKRNAVIAQLKATQWHSKTFEEVWGWMLRLLLCIISR